MKQRKYGVVYTPERLADFAAELMRKEAQADNFNIDTILDPACGECALLLSAQKLWGTTVQYLGIDVDKDAIAASEGDFEIKHNDAILPQNVKKKTAEYWISKLPKVTGIIANPPWSSEKIYDRSVLLKAGFTLVNGQYDSYVLFIELAYNLLAQGGYFSFIIPDSLFDAQNKQLRQFLLEKTEIRVIVRLGEKIFDGVNRATTIIVCKKVTPSPDSKTKCFRLSTDARKKFLSTDATLMQFYEEASHEVSQTRFYANGAYNFDIDTRSEEEALLKKIKEHSINWEDTFIFGRGVEISKAGKIVICPHCGYAQGYKKSQLADGHKTCANCGFTLSVNAQVAQNVITKEATQGSVQIFVGENIKRYSITGERYIQPDIQGINYKNRAMYAPPKLLVRKTGLGIYSAIDYTGSMTSQTVYILKLKNVDNTIPLEYYLALLNSRVVYYYYLKVYGENEWKSHPYLTKQIVYSLPLREYAGDVLDKQIIKQSMELARAYTHDRDIELEQLIIKKYGLTSEERKIIFDEMNSLPDLGAVNGMKTEVMVNV